MIESLTLAAEVTAALLVLSTARPTQGPSAQTADAPVVPPLSGRTPNELDGACAHWARQLHSQTIQTAGPEIQAISAAIDALAQMSLDTRSLGDGLQSKTFPASSSDLDPLTQCPRREAIDAYLQQLQRLDANARSASWLAILQIENWTALRDSHSAVAAERALRTMADAAKKHMGSWALVFRNGHPSLVALLSGLPASLAPTCLEVIRQRLVHEVQVDGEPAAQIDLSTAMMPIGEADLEIVWQRLDEGLVEAADPSDRRTRWWDAEASCWQIVAADVPVPSTAIDAAQEAGSSAESAAAPVSETVEAPAASPVNTTPADEPSPEMELAADLHALFFAAKQQPVASEPTPVPAG